MIKGLQRRLMAVLLLFLVGIYTGLCAVNYATSVSAMERESEMLLRQLAERGPGGGLDPFDRGQGQAGLPYFILYTDSSGYILEVSQGQFLLSDARQLGDLVERALASREDSGYLPEYSLRFCRVGMRGGWKLVFLDDSLHREMRATQIRGGVVLGLALVPVFALFSWLLAAFISRPARRAWEQQAQFVADASHELKTPLTVILANTDMILADCSGEDTALRRRMDSIGQEAQRMRALVLDMLELARSDAAPRKKERPAAVDLSVAVESAALGFEAVAYEQGLALESKTEEGLWAAAHQAQLEQLLEILLDNAVKYSLPGGLIRVELAREKGKYALLTVSNPSEMLTEEQLEKVFDRFYRADKARSLRAGYGLGLAVARRLVESWGGKIWAEHREGVTRFLVRLPLEKPRNSLLPPAKNT